MASCVVTADRFVHAAMNSKPSVVRAYLDDPATAHLVNVLSTEGKSAVEEAARSGDVYVLELLLLHCGDPPPAAHHVHQAFHLAALQGHAGAVQFLLQQERVPVDVNVRNEGGQTALHLATQRGHADALKVLLDKAKPDPYLRQTQGGMTPAELAHAANAHECTALLKAYAPIWHRHVTPLVVRVMSECGSRLACLPLELVTSHVLGALAGPAEHMTGEGKQRRQEIMQDNNEVDVAMEQSEEEEDDDNDEEEEFPVVLSQETKRRKLRRCGTDEDAEAYVFKGLLPSSQDSNDSFSSSEGDCSRHCKSGRHHSRRHWVSLKGHPLPSHSFCGDPME